MDIRIEKIETGNSHLLNHVHEHVFDHDVSADYVAAYLNESNHVMFVAVAGTLVVGQIRAIFHSHPDQAPELYVDNLGVTPTYQRKGIASRLCAEVFKVGKERGCVEIWLGTEADNVQAIAFYQSLDLKMEDMVMFYGDLI